VNDLMESGVRGVDYRRSVQVTEWIYKRMEGRWLRVTDMEILASGSEGAVVRCLVGGYAWFGSIPTRPRGPTRLCACFQSDLKLLSSTSVMLVSA
jgi:hypothetical protein